MDLIERKISVVIPIYNVEDILKECLDALFRSSYKNFDVVIVNDCSQDKSVEIAKKYPCKIINLSEHKGTAFARNKGLDLAEGEIVACLDSDCLAPESWLTKINEKLTRNISAIGGKYKLPKGANFIINLFMVYVDLKHCLYSSPKKLTSLSGGNCAFWKSVLMEKRDNKELIYCNKGFHGGEDTIRCCEIRKFGQFIYDPDLFVVHNKKCALLPIIKNTIVWGCSGATVAGLYGHLLIREPHRLYKFFLYLISISFLLFTLIVPFTHAWLTYVCFIIFYLAAQVPLIALTYINLLRHTSVLFLPIVIFISDMLYLIGHIKVGCNIILRKVKSAIMAVR